MINFFISIFQKSPTENKELSSQTNVSEKLDSISNISLKIAIILKTMIEKKFLLQFSSLSFGIVW